MIIKKDLNLSKEIEFSDIEFFLKEYSLQDIS